MIKYVMGDLWKSIDDINLKEDMSSAKIGLKVLDAQKSVFENVNITMLQIQQQTEKMVKPLLANNSVVPEELRNILKKNQVDIKKAIDEGFDKTKAYFSTISCPAKEAKQSVEETAKAEAPPQTDN